MSVNPHTGESIEIPSADDGSSQILLDDFLAAHADKPLVVIQGLGFVGAAMAAVCANAHGADYAVIGVDLATADSYWKIASINQGNSPLLAADESLATLYEHARQRGNLHATHLTAAYAAADVIVVDINLDVQKVSSVTGELQSYTMDLGTLRSAIESIGQYCREDVLILVETTVPPGTCDQEVLPILRRCMLERGLEAERFTLGHSYERVMPGPGYVESITNFYRVYAGINSQSAKRTRQFLETIIHTNNYPLTELHSTKASEMAKVLENSYRATNIAFVEEWSGFAEKAGVNLHAVIDAIRQRPTHANLMYPGLGVGGYCLTKDPLMADLATQESFAAGDLPMSVQAVRINDTSPARVAAQLIKLMVPHAGTATPLTGYRILILGVTYRGDVADTRYSPVELFCRSLATAGATLSYHDPYVGYWQEMDSQVSSDTDSWPAIFAEDMDAVVLCAAHRQYRDQTLVDALANVAKPLLVLDTLGFFSDKSLATLADVGHTVKVVGRGDL